MKKKDIKVENSANYWVDFEGELSVYFHFKWNTPDSISYLQSNRKEFIEEYIRVAKKYGIAVPINKANGDKLSYNSFSTLYKVEDNYFYPTELFIDKKDKKTASVISINPILTFPENKSNYTLYSSIPFRVELFNNETEIKLLCYLDNDIFNLTIDNKKTKSNPEIGGEGYWIDNSELAYLNTPRLNSYLRDIKNLCTEFKMNFFEFENLGLEEFSEKGVLFNNEIVYYEDISDLLLLKHQIVK